MSTVTERITGNFPAVTAATDQSTTIAESHVAGTVTAATITVNGNITANATTYRTFTLVNKGTDGNGTTAVAVFATDTVTTDDVADFDEKALTLSATAAGSRRCQGRHPRARRDARQHRRRALGRARGDRDRAHGLRSAMDPKDDPETARPGQWGSRPLAVSARRRYRRITPQEGTTHAGAGHDADAQGRR
jgi:hypothetical protein